MESISIKFRQNLLFLTGSLRGQSKFFWTTTE